MKTENFIRLVKRGDPWGFANYTAEAMKVIGSNTGGLRRWLMQGMEHRQLAYWMGRPPKGSPGCKLCERVVSARYRQVIDGDILNCDEFRNGIVPLLDGRVVWVGSEPPFTVTQHIKITKWDRFESIRRMTFAQKSFVLIDAGTTGTVLAWHWYYRCPRCTVIDVQNIWNQDHSSSQEADPASVVA